MTSVLFRGLVYAIGGPCLDLDRQAVNAWIGANDLATEGEFLWVEDGSPVQSADAQWGASEPDNAGEGEGCVFLHFYTGLWADLLCARTVAFWCQRQAGEQGGTSAAGNSEQRWAIAGVFRRVLFGSLWYPSCSPVSTELEWVVRTMYIAVAVFDCDRARYP